MCVGAVLVAIGEGCIFLPGNVVLAQLPSQLIMRASPESKSQQRSRRPEKGGYGPNVCVASKILPSGERYEFFFERVYPVTQTQGPACFLFTDL